MAGFYREAAALIDLGFAVLPLAAGSKTPMKGTAGWKDATLDRSVVGAWAREWPKANLGVRTGRESNLSVVDIDAHHDGIALMKRWIARHGRCPDCGPLVRTPRGGFHMWFAFDARLKNRTGGDSNGHAGVDVKSGESYIVVPPTWWNGMTNRRVDLPGGGGYHWLRRPSAYGLPRAPEWLVAKLAPPKPKRRIVPSEFSPSAEWFDSKVLGLAAEAALLPQGQRNERLNELAFQAFALAIRARQSLDYVEAEMIKAGEASGHHEKSVALTVRSARRGAERKAFA